MEIILLPKAQEHLLHWQKTNNKIILKKISILIDAIFDDPYTGIGKPERLMYELTGKWSRRIDKGNRIIYEVINDTLFVYALKGHY